MDRISIRSVFLAGRLTVNGARGGESAQAPSTRSAADKGYVESEREFDMKRLESAVILQDSLGPLTSFNSSVELFIV
jgi:hypothetical protein